MADESFYELLLRRAPDHAEGVARAALHDRLMRVPPLEELGPGYYGYGEPDQHGRMEMWMLVEGDDGVVRPLGPDESLPDQVEGLKVRIPRPWATARGPQVWAMVFMAAEWAGWEVFDPQIDGTLQKEVVLSGLVAMRQQQLEREGRLRKRSGP